MWGAAPAQGHLLALPARTRWPCQQQPGESPAQPTGPTHCLHPASQCRQQRPRVQGAVRGCVQGGPAAPRAPHPCPCLRGKVLRRPRPQRAGLLPAGAGVDSHVLQASHQAPPGRTMVLDPGLSAREHGAEAKARTPCLSAVFWSPSGGGQVTASPRGDSAGTRLWPHPLSTSTLVCMAVSTRIPQMRTRRLRGRLSHHRLLGLMGSSSPRGLWDTDGGTQPSTGSLSLLRSVGHPETSWSMVPWVPSRPAYHQAAARPACPAPPPPASAPPHAGGTCCVSHQGAIVGASLKQHPRSRPARPSRRLCPGPPLGVSEGPTRPSCLHPHQGPGVPGVSPCLRRPT